MGSQDMVCWGSLRTGLISYECWPSSLIIYIVLPTLVTPSHARDNFIIFYASLFISVISEAGHWIMRICTYTKYYQYIPSGISYKGALTRGKQSDWSSFLEIPLKRKKQSILYMQSASFIFFSSDCMTRIRSFHDAISLSSAEYYDH